MAETMEVSQMSDKDWHELSCEERIDEAKKDRFDDFEKMRTVPDVSEMDMYEIEEELSKFSRRISDFRYTLKWPFTYVDTQEIQDFLNNAHYTERENYPLHVQEYIAMRIELSTGGPGDYIMLIIDKEEKYVISGTYHYLDWFDGAIRGLDKYELDLIEELYSYLWDY